jgi:hypothetical protein
VLAFDGGSRFKAESNRLAAQLEAQPAGEGGEAFAGLALRPPHQQKTRNEESDERGRDDQYDPGVLLATARPAGRERD